MEKRCNYKKLQIVYKIRTKTKKKMEGIIQQKMNKEKQIIVQSSSKWGRRYLQDMCFCVGDVNPMGTKQYEVSPFF